MKRKGFTLVELIGIVVIISLIVIIVFPTVLTTLNKKAEKEYQTFKALVVSAAEVYYERNSSTIPNIYVKNYRTFTPVSNLIAAGLINPEMINPKTNAKISPTSYITSKATDDNLLEFDYYEDKILATDYYQTGLLWMYDGYTKSSQNSWTDLSGNNRDANIYGMESNGWNGNGVKLDGIDDYIQVANTSYTILPRTHAFTFEYVLEVGNINSESEDSNESSPFCTYGLNHHYWCINNLNKLKSMNRKSDNSANNWSSANPNIIFTMGTNYTVSETYTYDSTNDYYVVQYYINGKKITTTSQNTSALAYVDYLYIGRYSSYYYTGIVKSVRIYDSGLTEAQIVSNYEVDKNRF